MLNNSSNNANENETNSKVQVDPKIVREQISEWEKYIKAEEKILGVTAILLKHKIIGFDDIEQLKHDQDRNLLNENKFITSSILCDTFNQCNMFHQLKNNPKYIEYAAIQEYVTILSSDHENIGDAHYYIDPSDEELKLFKKQYLSFRLATNRNINKNDATSVVSLIESKKYIDKSDKEFLGGLVRISEWQKQNFNCYFAEQENKDNYRNKVIKHYEVNISILKDNIYKTSQLLISLEQALQKKYKGQATYHNLFNGIRKEQSGTILELRNQEKEEERKLLVNLIMNDNDLNEVQKQEAFNNITNEDLDYEIDRWLGKKLTKQERRILRVLRRIIYQMIEQEEITGIGKSIYEAEIPLSRIYEEYGLENREHGGYQHKQTKIIQDVLFGFSTRGLHEDILFKHTTIMKTRFILQIEKIKQRVIGIERTTSIRIAMPHFLFVSDKKASSYYYQDTEGFKKFMAIKGMSQSEAAFNIVEYLEWFLSSKLKERSLNQSTLIEEGGIELKKRYKNHKGEVLETIETILNNMVRAGYLVKEWRLENGKYRQAQYIFKNLRYELFIADKNKCEVTKLSTKKTTKSRKYSDK